MKSILLTGATGFIGSHLAVELLNDPENRLVTVARAKKGRCAAERVHDAIRTAAQDAGREIDTDLSRRILSVEVIEGDLTDANLESRLAGLKIDKVWHCAAKVGFAESLRKRIEATNIEGTARLLDWATKQSAVEFNYVSTAYVAGDKDGEVFETLAPEENKTNNPYEESKRSCERAVMSAAKASGMAYRIFRPSIVVAHSKTGRGNTNTGFYGFIILAARRKDEIDSKMPNFFERFPVRLFTHIKPSINIIPVDRVVGQMVAVDSAPVSRNEIYNIVSDNNVTIEELAQHTRHEMGISFVTTNDQATLGPVDHIVNRNVDQFSPPG